MRTTEIELHLIMNVSPDGFTINALLEQFEELEEELFRALLDGFQREQLWAARRDRARPIECPRCGDDYWVKRGKRTRRLKTSRGQLQFPLRQVTCKGCGRTWSPFLGRLGPPSGVSEELRRPAIGLATEISYRKASHWTEKTTGPHLSPATIWRTVQERGPAVEFTPGPEDGPRLEADGTRLPAGLGERGVALNLTFAVGDRWPQNGRWRREKRVVGMAVGRGSWPEALPGELDSRLVVNDGGEDVRGAAADAYPEARAQRCEWHVAYSLDHALWQDGVEHSRRLRLQEELRGLLFGPERSRSRRTQVREWAGWRLAPYPQAQNLVEGALPEICYPVASDLRTTGHAERPMREVNRRTDIGVRWSERGVENLLRLRLARLYNPGDYDRVWNSQTIELRLEARVSLASMSTT